MMTRHISQCCRLARSIARAGRWFTSVVRTANGIGIAGLCFASAGWCLATGIDDVLIVGPGESLRVEPPEAGSSSEAALDGGPLVPTTELTAPAAGDHWLAVAGRDRSGNLSPVRWIHLRVDRSPPAIDLRAEPAPIVDASGHRWVPASAQITAVSKENLAGTAKLTLTVAGETTETSAEHLSVGLPTQQNSAGLPAMDEGIEATAWAVDRVGNRSLESSLRLLVDTVPPTIETTIRPRVTNHEGLQVLTPTSQLTVTVKDSESGPGTLTARVDGEHVADTQDTPWALEKTWETGRHLVELTAVDRVGNTVDPEPLRFSVDDTGPEISWRVSSPGVEGTGDEASAGEWFYRTPVTVVADATDELAGLDRIESSIDGAVYHPVEGPIEVAGNHLSLRAVDRLGNHSHSRAEWSLDATPPEIRLVTVSGEQPPGEQVVGGHLVVERDAVLEIQASDRDAGLASATYTLEERSGRIWRRNWWHWHSQPLSGQLVMDRSGRLALTVEAVDRLGNAATARWLIEVRRPTKGELP